MVQMKIVSPRTKSNTCNMDNAAVTHMADATIAMGYYLCDVIKSLIHALN